jgi:hypothetical protein
MRKWLVLLSICLSCASKEENQEPAAAYEAPENETWFVYEGVVRSDAGNDIKMELSLLQNSVGLESEYRTEEEFINSRDDRLFTTRKGTYSILYGAGGEMVITLHESSGQSLGWQPGKGYSIDPKLPSEKIRASARVGQLVLKTGRNSNELMLLDEDSNPVAADDRYTLKRRSILFTVEGFVTIEPTVTDFFELNTRENWIVAQSGSYGEVQQKYVELATEKHEGIYLKAVAFYIDDADESGAGVRNLVIKEIISMKSHQEHIATR